MIPNVAGAGRSVPPSRGLLGAQGRLKRPCARKQSTPAA